MGVPTGRRQRPWSPDHAVGPVVSQCRRHSDPAGARALLPHLHRNFPQRHALTTPGQTLCGGNALAFSTSLRQSGLRRQPSRRQRPEQRPEEAGGEEAPLLAALEQHNRAGRKGQSSTAPCSAPGGGPQEFTTHFESSETLMVVWMSIAQWVHLFSSGCNLGSNPQVAIYTCVLCSFMFVIHVLLSLHF